jgi:signal transduction histidine kinase
VTEAAAGRALVIAVVDDDEVDRLAVRRALHVTHPGATIVVGETAAEARLLVAREALDVLLLDLVLPDGDGAAVVSELRGAGFDVPIVVMTGHGDEQTAVAIMKSGASDYIPKAALSAERLGQSIRHALRVREADLATRAAREELESYAARLQVACQARDDMIGVVSHDLRNPLSTILLAARFLREGHADDATKRRAHVDRIVRSADLMLRLISDLLDVTRIESGQLSIEKQDHPARELAEHAVDSVRELAAKAGLTLELRVEGELPVIAVDHDRILQALGNLLGNALKFTPGGGLVRVRAREAGGHVVFSVEDSGPGIAPSDLPHIFDRYFQGRARASLGTGLGLFIAKGIVVAHGGTIHVESQLGKGTTFWFRVPVASAGASSVA